MERRLLFPSGGERIAGTLHLPDDLRAGERRPGVVLCNTFAAVKDMALSRLAVGLCQVGLTVLAFDYRSFGESEGEPRCSPEPWKQVEDARSAATCLQQQPEVDPDSLAILGAGLGGGVAVAAAAGDQRFRTAVVLAPVGDGARWLQSLRSAQDWALLSRRLAHDRIRRASSGYSEYITALSAAGICVAPCDDRAVAAVERAYSISPTLRRQVTLAAVEAITDFVPEALAERIAPRPLLVLAASRDYLVPAHEASTLFALAREPKSLVYVSEEAVTSHYDWFEGPGAAEVLGTLADWLETHLPLALRARVRAEAAATVETGAPQPAARPQEIPTAAAAESAAPTAGAFAPDAPAPPPAVSESAAPTTSAVDADASGPLSTPASTEHAGSATSAAAALPSAPAAAGSAVAVPVVQAETAPPPAGEPGPAPATNPMTGGGEAEKAAAGEPGPSDVPSDAASAAEGQAAAPPPPAAETVPAKTPPAAEAAQPEPAASPEAGDSREPSEGPLGARGEIGAAAEVQPRTIMSNPPSAESATSLPTAEPTVDTTHGAPAKTPAGTHDTSHGVTSPDDVTPPGVPLGSA